MPPPPHFLTPHSNKRVSIYSEYKQLSACTVPMPDKLIPEDLWGKN